MQLRAKSGIKPVENGLHYRALTGGASGSALHNTLSEPRVEVVGFDEVLPRPHRVRVEGGQA